MAAAAAGGAGKRAPILEAQVIGELPRNVLLDKLIPLLPPGNLENVATLAGRTHVRVLERGSVGEIFQQCATASLETLQGILSKKLDKGGVKRLISDLFDTSTPDSFLKSYDAFCRAHDNYNPSDDLGEKLIDLHRDLEPKMHVNFYIAAHETPLGRILRGYLGIGEYVEPSADQVRSAWSKAQRDGVLADITTLRIDTLGRPIYLPPQMKALTNLIFIRVAGGQLKEFPPVLSRMPSLEVIDVQYNEITEIPREICDLENLDLIWANNNPIDTLPESISERSKTLEIELWGNRVTRADVEKLTGSNVKITLPGAEIFWGQPPERGAICTIS